MTRQVPVLLPDDLADRLTTVEEPAALLADVVRVAMVNNQRVRDEMEACGVLPAIRGGRPRKDPNDPGVLARNAEWRSLTVQQVGGRSVPVALLDDVADWYERHPLAPSYVAGDVADRLDGKPFQRAGGGLTLLKFDPVTRRPSVVAEMPEPSGQ